MSWTQINSVTISDIHFGCVANSSEKVIAGLEKKLTPAYLKDVNIVYIGGDVFERGLPTNHPDIPHIVSWQRRFLARCGRLGIIVIIIEGTPSHDRKQSHLFTAINDAASDEDKCELYYVTEVDILFIPKYGINVLCVPDEKNTSDDITLKQVKDMMATRAIDKVDFAVMHGFFDFQVPAGRTTRYHDSKAYLELVRYLIWIGHDHTFRKYDRIIVQGSPDRQRHGMEEDKGFVYTTVYKNGTYKATFEVNQYAMVFKTVTVDSRVDVATREVHSTCDSIGGHGHVRIAANHDHPVLGALDSFRVKYPFIKFSKLVLDEAPKSESIVNTDESLEYVPFTIDPENIKVVVKDRLPIALMTDAEKQYFESLMDSVI